MKVPFVDLYAQYKRIQKDIDDAIAAVIQQTAFIGGAPVQQFEKDFAAFTGIEHIIGCANGTDSIEILLQSFGIGKGDEVIVPASSWISTSEAVSAVGAIPVFVDIEENFYSINPVLIDNAVTSKTKAIIPVHLYGHPADMPAIMAIAKKYSLIVIEDCAQSHGAAIDGKMTGSFGHAASFSFYPGKNLGAYGDAGCMATNDATIAAKARMIANHGQQGKHNHLMEGRNSRLDALHAAILSAKLPYINRWTNERIQHAIDYGKRLQAVTVPVVKENYKHVFHLYVIQTNRRELLQKKLNNAGVDTAIHYPVALPFLACYKKYGFQPTDFPVAYRYQSQILSIPMYAELEEAQIKYIADIINTF
ncbi:MAG TPA: DegT/DnrJ/EryC1/StrS family aminotransferase [Ferruginibacter sp.]|nr:DegT/DnrJ/EryC1/StrS family aminotransferase [Ferruginibacter sp.]